MKGRNAFSVLMGGARKAASVSRGTEQPASVRPTACSKVPASAPRKDGGTQLHLDLGQRDFAVATCPTCGMLYGKGLPEEERLHEQFHNAHNAVFRFQGWSSERVVVRDGTRCRLLCVLPSDPAAHLKKVQEVCSRLEKVLGVPEGYLLADKPPFKVFLWVTNEPNSATAGSGSGKSRIAGVLVAQLQPTARRCPLSQTALSRPKLPTQQPQQQGQQHEQPTQHEQQQGQPEQQQQYDQHAQSDQTLPDGRQWPRPACKTSSGQQHQHQRQQQDHSMGATVPCVTAAPVTAAPVTAAPVTAAPVTAAPVTAAPVTAATAASIPASSSSSAASGAKPTSRRWPSASRLAHLRPPPPCAAGAAVKASAAAPKAAGGTGTRQAGGAAARPGGSAPVDAAACCDVATVTGAAVSCGFQPDVAASQPPSHSQREAAASGVEPPCGGAAEWLSVSLAAAAAAAAAAAGGRRRGCGAGADDGRPGKRLCGSPPAAVPVAAGPRGAAAEGSRGVDARGQDATVGSPAVAAQATEGEEVDRLAALRDTSLLGAPGAPRLTAGPAAATAGCDSSGVDVDGAGCGAWSGEALRRPGATAAAAGPAEVAGREAVCSGWEARGPQASDGRTAAGTAARSASGALPAHGEAAAQEGGRDGEAAVRVLMGVRGLWVEKGSRRRGLARRMLDAARCCMVPGVAADRSQVAFSACAAAAAAGDDDGGAGFAAFAVSYSGGSGSAGTPGEGAWVLLYDDDDEGEG